MKQEIFGTVDNLERLTEIFQNEFLENFCSIQFCTGNSGNFGLMEHALYSSFRIFLISPNFFYQNNIIMEVMISQFF